MPMLRIKVSCHINMIHLYSINNKFLHFCFGLIVIIIISYYVLYTINEMVLEKNHKTDINMDLKKKYASERNMKKM